MKLYDEVITQCLRLLEAEQGIVWEAKDTSWPSVSDRSMILRSDMAFELGSGTKPAIGCTIITGSDELVKKDKVTLIGKDLPDIENDMPYARIALVRVNEDVLKEGEALYRAIRNLEYTRYHFYPEGFMMRVSASKQKESVRIGKEALEKGLSFEKTGSKMIKAFHEHDLVESVSIYYITKENFDYETLARYAKEAESITKTIDHISTSAIMDCNACNLQQVCDEVEGLRELHFAK